MQFKLENAREYYLSFMEAVRLTKFRAFVESLDRDDVPENKPAISALIEGVDVMLEGRVSSQVLNSWKRYMTELPETEGEEGTKASMLERVMEDFRSKVAAAGDDEKAVKNAALSLVANYAPALARTINSYTTNYGQSDSVAADMFNDAAADLYQQAMRYADTGAQVAFQRYQSGSDFLISSMGKNYVPAQDDRVEFDDNGNPVRTYDWGHTPKARFNGTKARSSMIVKWRGKRYRRKDKTKMNEEQLRIPPDMPEVSDFWEEMNSVKMTLNRKIADEGGNGNDIISERVNQLNNEGDFERIPTGRPEQSGDSVDYDNKANSIISKLYSKEEKQIKEMLADDTIDEATSKRLNKRLDKINTTRALLLDKKKLRDDNDAEFTDRAIITKMMNNKSKKEVEAMIPGLINQLRKMKSGEIRSTPSEIDELTRNLKAATDYIAQPKQPGYDKDLYTKHNVSGPHATALRDEAIPEFSRLTKSPEPVVKAASVGDNLYHARLDPRVREREIAYHDLAKELGAELSEIKSFGENKSYDILADRGNFVNGLMQKLNDPEVGILYNISKQMDLPLDTVIQNADSLGLDVKDPMQRRKLISSLVDVGDDNGSEYAKDAEDEAIFSRLAKEMEISPKSVESRAAKLKINPKDKTQIRKLISDLVDSAR